MTASVNNASKSTWLHIALLVAAIVIAYGKVFTAGFMSWDDLDYVFHTKDISNGVGWEQVQNWFTHNYIGNYQPLPIFTYALDYAIGSTNPFVYHLDSILWHIADAILVYYFTNKLQSNKWAGFFVALLFAVHPVQTESVSWIAARNKGMNTFFYIAALCFYISYIHTRKNSKLILASVMGLLAYLCKATALSLPLAMFAVDIWLRRPLNVRSIWLEKLPLIVVGIPVALATLAAQKDVNFLEHHGSFGFSNILFAGYALSMYIVHLLFPVGLSVLYPYPKEVAAIHWFGFIAAIGIVFALIISFRRKQYVWAGGLLFFIVNMLPVLQFVQFGETIMADRYLYTGCIGLFYPLVYTAFTWAENKQKTLLALGTASVVSVVLLASTFVRNTIWQSEINFWNSVLEQFPESAVAQYSMGAALMKDGNLNDAERHLNLAVQYDPANYKAWHNKGSLHLRQGKAMEALEALNKSLEITPYPKAYFTRALLYQGMHNPELAIADARKVLEAQPDNSKAWYIIADCEEQLGKLAEAGSNYSRAINYDNKEPLFFIRRGLLQAKTGKKTEALADLEQAVAIKPDNAEAHYYRGLIKYSLGKDPCTDLKDALKLGYKPAAELTGKVCR